LLAACTPASYVPEDMSTGDATAAETGASSGTETAASGEPVKWAFDLELEVVWPDDLDGDGHLDLVLDSSVGPARLVRGGGEGNFYAPIEIGEPGLGPAVPTGAGDFDGDGVRDLVVWSSQTELPFVTRTGLGGELATWPLARGGLAAVADANGDGRDDLVFKA